jgi:hypothetical protein
MGLIGRLRAAWAALVSDEHDNESHRWRSGALEPWPGSHC